VKPCFSTRWIQWWYCAN